jgi:hypothetical protein
MLSAKQLRRDTPQKQRKRFTLMPLPCAAG